MKSEGGRPRPDLVLASASPRRRELLGRLGAAFVVRPAGVDETPQPGEAAADLVRRLAVAKAEAGLAAATEPEVVVLAADTVVAVDGEMLAKPADGTDATRMLRSLSGRTHVVLTGMAVAHRSIPPDEPVASEAALAPTVGLAVEVETTDVTFRELSDADIARYVATGEPLDKAGAYAIQGAGAAFVFALRGSRDNVIGLDLDTTRRLLTEAGVELLRR